MKEESKELFRVSPARDIYNLLEMQMQQILPDRDENGCAIYIFRVRMYLKCIKTFFLLCFINVFNCFSFKQKNVIHTNVMWKKYFEATF